VAINIFAKILLMNYKLLLFLLIPFASCIRVNADGSRVVDRKDSVAVSVNTKWKSEDEFFRIYYLLDKKIELTDKRPSKKDTAVFLCIPAAFTQLDDGSIDGLFIINGKITDPKKVNHHLGGGLLIVNDQLQIIKTNDGKLLTDKWKDSIVSLNGSFLQQIQLVRNGAALEFNKDQKLFQRRAVVLYRDSTISIVESKNAITLQEFADDLVKMKTLNAIYTDMGSYDEGWARNPGKGAIEVIGDNRTQTLRQSNWLIFRK
jgi:hypothetical protein